MSTNHHRPIDTVSCDDLVSDVLQRVPRTAAVFIGRNMACPGCAMAPFMTVAEAAASYDLDPEELRRDLAAIAGEVTPA